MLPVYRVSLLSPRAPAPSRTHPGSAKQQCVYGNRSLDPEPNSTSPCVSTDQLSWHKQGDHSNVAACFLDHDLFLSSQVQFISTIHDTAPIFAYAQQFVGDSAACQQIADRYYHLIHPWLPIISKKKVYRHLLNPLVPKVADTVFLFLCMNLYSQYDAQDAWTPAYYAAVRCLNDLQLAGTLTFEMLQGCILLAVYEYGHAIYPAAQVSASISLKYALSLGMGWNTPRTEARKMRIWFDEEEDLRTWWAIYLLERCVAAPLTSISS